MHCIWEMSGTARFVRQTLLVLNYAHPGTFSTLYLNLPWCKNWCHFIVHSVQTVLLSFVSLNKSCIHGPNLTEMLPHTRKCMTSQTQSHLAFGHSLPDTRSTFWVWKLNISQLTWYNIYGVGNHLRSSQTLHFRLFQGTALLYCMKYGTLNTEAEGGILFCVSDFETPSTHSCLGLCHQSWSIVSGAQLFSRFYLFGITSQKKVFIHDHITASIILF